MIVSTFSLFYSFSLQSMKVKIQSIKILMGPNKDDFAFDERDIQKYYFLSEKQRPEVFISKITDPNQIISEIWNAILISLRVLDNDLEISEFLSTTCFPNLSNSDHKYATIAKNIMSTLSDALELFQPDVVRKVDFLNLKLNTDTEIPTFSVYTTRFI